MMLNHGGEYGFMMVTVMSVNDGGERSKRWFVTRIFLGYSRSRRWPQKWREFLGAASRTSRADHGIWALLMVQNEYPPPNQCENPVVYDGVPIENGDFWLSDVSFIPYFRFLTLLEGINATCSMLLTGNNDQQEVPTGAPRAWMVVHVATLVFSMCL